MRLIVLYFFICFFISCGNAHEEPVSRASSAKATTIAWIDSVKDYGKINEGQKLAVSFRFRNSGSNPLIIESVHPGCGCTVADFPKEPIAPGAEGEITGEFNSESRPGHAHKSIGVKANTGGFGDHEVYFDVEVIPAKQASEENNK